MSFVVVARILSFDVDFECQARLKAGLIVVVKNICIFPSYYGDGYRDGASPTRDYPKPWLDFLYEQRCASKYF